MHKTAQEEKCLGIMDDSHSTLKTLNKLVKDKLFNQVKEVDYNTTEQDPNINVYQDNNQPRSKSQNPETNQINKTTASIGLENINYFEMYKSEFDNKVVQWCNEEVKTLNYDFQKLNYMATKPKNRDRRSSIFTEMMAKKQ